MNKWEARATLFILTLLLFVPASFVHVNPSHDFLWHTNTLSVCILQIIVGSIMIIVGVGAFFAVVIGIAKLFKIAFPDD